jgi:hypothetical protein
LNVNEKDINAQTAQRFAALKTLPMAQRKALWEFLQEHGYDEAIAHVKKEFGVKTSAPALSGFFQWYPLASQLEEAASLTNQLKTELLAICPV